MVHAVLVFVQLCLASLAVAAKLALRELPPPGLVFLRVGGAALALAAIVRLAGGSVGVRERADYTRFALYALLGVTANQLLYMQGLAYTTAINANILITTVPAFTLAIALVTRQERATWTGVSGVLLAMAGAIVLIGPGGVSVSPRFAVGNALIVLNALAYSVFLVISKPALRSYEPLTMMAWVFLFGALGVSPFAVPALVATDLSDVHLATWLLVAYIVLVPTIAGYWLSLWALKRTTSSVVAVYIYLQPIVTILVAPSILGERLRPESAVAAAAIFLGIALVARAQRRSRERGAVTVVE